MEEINSKSNISDKIWLFFELMAIPYFLAPLFVAGIFGEYFGLSLEAWWNVIIKTVIPILIFVPILGYLTSFTDYRFRILLHIVVIAILVNYIVMTGVGLGYYTPNLPINELLQAFFAMYIFSAPIGFAAAINAFKESQKHLEILENTMLQAKSGNYDIQIKNKNTLKDSVFGSLATHTNEMIYSTKLFIENINSTDLLATTAQQISKSIHELSTVSEELASSSNSMSDIALEQTNEVQRITDNLNEMKETINSISERIQYPVSVLQEIAGTTKILAINAGIEASRAGEYGRGFKEVATNIQQLSNESKQSTADISQRTEDVISELATIYDELFNSIQNLAASSEETSSSAEEVAAVAEEIDAGVQEINLQSNQLNERAEESKKYLSSINIPILN